MFQNIIKKLKNRDSLLFQFGIKLINTSVFELTMQQLVPEKQNINFFGLTV